jgi:hypothetical protein
MFLRQYKDKELFYGHYILMEGVFVAQLSENAGNSVWRIVWITKILFLFSRAMFVSLPGSYILYTSIVKTTKVMHFLFIFVFIKN